MTDQPQQTPETPSAEEPRYEPPPSVGKLLGWILVFVLAAIVVVLGGVYFT
ncbi:hypothetical protein ACWGQ5_00595 [Streptomyces sp. NPDC055722]